MKQRGGRLTPISLLHFASTLLTVFFLETLLSCLSEIHVERPQVAVVRQAIQQSALFWSSLCKAKGRPVYEQGTSFARCFRRSNAASR